MKLDPLKGLAFLSHKIQNILHKGMVFQITLYRSQNTKVLSTKQRYGIIGLYKGQEKNNHNE
jgi:hypothetical protein